MFDQLSLFQDSLAMARHAGRQQAVSAQNIANADTPGFRGFTLPDFAESYERDGPGDMPLRATRPGHIVDASVPGSAEIRERTDITEPSGNGVSLEAELIAATRARGQHDEALAIFRNGISVLRASLGRR